MLKFMHCADLHLDSPLSRLELSKAEVRRNEIRAAFTSLTLYARMNGISLLLISGDMLDSDYLSRDTLALILREFAALSETKIVIAPGNHDPYTQKSVWRRAEFPENVCIFDSEELSYFDFPELNTRVYGYAFTSSELTSCPFEGLSPDDSSRINILMAHGSLGMSSGSDCPIPYEAIERSSFDYVALGHYHKFDGIRRLGSSFYAYSGCLESRGFDELGEKGAIVGTVSKDSTLKLAAKLVRFSKRRYEYEKLDVTGAKSNADLLDKLSALITERHFGADTALRVILTGEVDPGMKASTELLSSSLPGLFLIEVEDRTVPTLDAESLASDPTIRGEFYRALADSLASESELEREAAAEALRLGLAAIAGEELA